MKFLRLSVVAVALASIAATPVYKWVDQQGKVHYADRAPPPDSDGKALTLLAPPSEGEVQQAGAQLAELLSKQAASRESRAAQQERERLERELAEARRIDRQNRCLVAQQNKHVLELGRPVYSIDEKGERQFLDDAARAAQMQKIRVEIAENCQ